jgi:hypothetical protein
MPGTRAEVLLTWMDLIDFFTLGRALDGLTQDEFDWKPHPGAWGVARREACTTPTPGGAADGEWVVDNDWAVVMAAYDEWKTGVSPGEATKFEPMSTIGWLLNHFGAAPGFAATLTFVGGDVRPTPEVYAQMWGHTILGSADEAVARFRDGWAALRTAVAGATDAVLERPNPGYPSPPTSTSPDGVLGYVSLAGLLNEVSHHGTQICMLRDLFRQQVAPSG